MRMQVVIVATSLLTAVGAGGSTAWAQQATTGLENSKGVVWGSIGFQADIGGSVNSSGIGNILGLPAEINANTWGERYDTSLLIRVGGAYNYSNISQVTFAVYWEQGESDEAPVGLLGGQQLNAKFSDQQGWGMDVGYRRFFPTTKSFKPFAGVAIGLQRSQDITATLEAPTQRFQFVDVPFYDDSWVIAWRLGGGFMWDIKPTFGVQVTLDLKYAGVLSDQAGLGQLFLERVNDTGNRWTLPVLGGFYVKF